MLRNDLTAVTYGEWRCGAATDARDVLCVFVGSGLGSGMVVDGRLYEGASGLAGELGHVTVVDGPEGWECGCGRAGCVEAYVGGRYLEARARLPPPDGLGDAGATCSSLDQAYRRGDPAAVRLWEQAADRLGQALTIGIQLLDPEVVVLGGGALDAAPNYRDLALAALRRRCPPAMLEGTPVVPAALGPLAGALGSALLARDESGG